MFVIPAQAHCCSAHFLHIDPALTVLSIGVFECSIRLPWPCLVPRFPRPPSFRRKPESMRRLFGIHAASLWKLSLWKTPSASNDLLLLNRGRWPGYAPGGAVPFFAHPGSPAERKEPKKGARTCRPSRSRPYASLRSTCGARSRGRPSRGGAVELAMFTAFTPLKQRRQVRA